METMEEVEEIEEDIKEQIEEMTLAKMKDLLKEHISKKKYTRFVLKNHATSV
jgi:hypothetical protein